MLRNWEKNDMFFFFSNPLNTIWFHQWSCENHSMDRKKHICCPIDVRNHLTITRNTVKMWNEIADNNLASWSDCILSSLHYRLNVMIFGSTAKSCFQLLFALINNEILCILALSKFEYHPLQNILTIKHFGW